MEYSLNIFIFCKDKNNAKRWSYLGIVDIIYPFCLNIQCLKEGSYSIQCCCVRLQHFMALYLRMNALQKQTIISEKMTYIRVKRTAPTTMNDSNIILNKTRSFLQIFSGRHVLYASLLSMSAKEPAMTANIARMQYMTV